MDKMATKMGGFLSDLKDAPTWAVNYAKERRRLFSPSRSGRAKVKRPRLNAKVKRSIATLKEAQIIFRKIEPKLPPRTDGRSEATIEDLQLAADTLARLLTPGAAIDAEFNATVGYLVHMYKQKTGRPHYQDVGFIVTEIFKDIRPKLKEREDHVHWVRKTATRYQRCMKLFSDDRTAGHALAQLQKSSLRECLIRW
jgi:hypothetical protein